MVRFSVSALDDEPYTLIRTFINKMTAHIHFSVFASVVGCVQPVVQSIQSTPITAESIHL